MSLNFQRILFGGDMDIVDMQLKKNQKPQSIYPIYGCQEPEIFFLVGSTYKNARLVWITDLPSGRYFANDDARLWYNVVSFLAGRNKDTKTDN
jgi:hypothetical protein